MTNVLVSESVELPILSGILEVNTINYPITIFMKPAPEDNILTITKVSDDNNIISLFSENTLINGADIVLFGLPHYAKTKKGKVKTIILKSDGINWHIIKEY